MSYNPTPRQHFNAVSKSMIGIVSILVSGCSIYVVSRTAKKLPCMKLNSFVVTKYKFGVTVKARGPQNFYLWACKLQIEPLLKDCTKNF